MTSGDTSQVICVGTAWVRGRASAEDAHEPPAPGTDLQFSRRGLDSSLLTDLYVILTGITYTEIATAARAGQPIVVGAQRIGGSQPAPYHTAHVFECSAEFRERMAALSPERIREIAQNWYPLLGHTITESSPGRVEYRSEIIQYLAALARVAGERSARLLLRVKYRAHT
jgi:hypothetical protein